MREYPHNPRITYLVMIETNMPEEFVAYTTNHDHVARAAIATIPWRWEPDQKIPEYVEVWVAGGKRHRYLCFIDKDDKITLEHLFHPFDWMIDLGYDEEFATPKQCAEWWLKRTPENRKKFP